MPSADITVVPYNGTLLSAQLLNPDTTLVLSAFGSAQSGTVIDNDGQWSDADDGISTFNGMTVNYIGTGTAQAGVALGPLTVGAGPEVTVVLFEAGGQIYFYYPDGAPSELGQIAMIINVDAVPYDGITPVCFTLGTLISTPGGEVPIEDLVPGALVLDTAGQSHRIRWIFRRHIGLDNLLPRVRRRMLPVFLPKDALGPGLPARDLRLSQQHLVSLSDPAVQLYFSQEEVLVPAKALVGDHIHLDHAAREVTYFQILCDSHVVVRANGLPAETLRLGPVGTEAMSAAQRAELNEIFPGYAEAAEWMPAALPVLSTAEGRVLRAALSGRRRLH